MLRPDRTYKSILDIDEKDLLKRGITCLIFDYDQTLVGFEKLKIKKSFIQKIKKLQKNFDVCVLSNCFRAELIKKRKAYLEQYHLPYYRGYKPFYIRIKTILRRYHCKNENICLIGDLLVTDIWAANIRGIYSIKVTPLNDNEPLYRIPFRKLENLFT